MSRYNRNIPLAVNPRDHHAASQHAKTLHVPPTAYLKLYMHPLDISPSPPSPLLSCPVHIVRHCRHYVPRATCPLGPSRAPASACVHPSRLLICKGATARAGRPRSDLMSSWSRNYMHTEAATMSTTSRPWACPPASRPAAPCLRSSSCPSSLGCLSSSCQHASEGKVPECLRGVVFLILGLHPGCCRSSSTESLRWSNCRRFQALPKIRGCRWSFANPSAMMC